MYYFSASYRMPVGYPCFAPGVTENLCHLARGGNLKETTDYLRSFGPWAIVVSFFSMSSSMPSDFCPPFFINGKWCYLWSASWDYCILAGRNRRCGA